MGAYKKEVTHMRKYTKKSVAFLLTLLISISFLGLNVSARDMSSSNNSSIHEVSYKIYDADGNLKASGVMPSSEKEASMRMNYGSQTLYNGYTMVLNNYGSSFIVPANATISMSFGLNRNINIFAGISETVWNSYLNSWQGYTGGLGISARTTKLENIIGEIQNLSSDPVTVTWANLNF